MEASKSAFKSHLSSNKWFYSVILILVLLAITLLILKTIDKKHHAQELAQTKERYTVQMREALDLNARRQLSLMMKTFVWAVRSSMLRSNLDEVDQYFIQLVQEEHIHEIVLADENGVILVATNKKHEGQSFSEHYPASLLRPEDVYFEHHGEYYYVSAPVLSLNTRLGTLFIVYEEEKVPALDNIGAEQVAQDSISN